METISRTSSGSIAIPIAPAKRQAPKAPVQYEYNAGLDAFAPSSPPDQHNLGKSLAKRFVNGLADWVDPQGAKGGKHI